MTEAMFFADLTQVKIGAEVLVSGAEGHHAVAVRRIRPGEVVRLSDGCGKVVLGTAISATKQGLCVRVEHFSFEPEPVLKISVAQGLAKGDRSDIAIAALTELGVWEIIPWQASRCVVRWADGERGVKQHQRWVATVREAAKQARRGFVPQISRLHFTADLCVRSGEFDYFFVLHEKAGKWLASCWRNFSKKSDSSLASEASSGGGDDSFVGDFSPRSFSIPEILAPDFSAGDFLSSDGGFEAGGQKCGLAGAETKILLVVGPEGGICDLELRDFELAGAQQVRIADHVLRTSTAGLVAVSQLQGLAHLFCS